MKALSLDLVRGLIDQVDAQVHMTWVQPRVLDKDQVSERLMEAVSPRKSQGKFILPGSVRTAKKQPQYKTLLKTHLFRLAFL